MLQRHVSLHVQANGNWTAARARARSNGSDSLEYSLINEGCFGRFKLRLWLGGKPSPSGHPRLISLPRQTDRPCLCGGGWGEGDREQEAHPISDSIGPRCGLCATAIILSTVAFAFCRGRRFYRALIVSISQSMKDQFDALYRGILNHANTRSANFSEKRTNLVSLFS